MTTTTVESKFNDLIVSSGNEDRKVSFDIKYRNAKCNSHLIFAIASTTYTCEINVDLQICDSGCTWKINYENIT